MKAFLLAAGLGTRLRPLTNTLPKCLVPIGNKPLMAYWLELFAKHQVNEVLINLHYLPYKVEAFLKSYPTTLTIKMIFEKELLGSGGTLWENRQWVVNESDFIIAYGDNLTNANLTNLVNFHRKHRPLLTMAVFKTQRPKECGIVSVDDQFTITHFEEKPSNPRSNLANAGLFVASPKIFEFFPETTEDKVLDLGFHVLPRLIGKMKAFELSDYLLDIGNLERYKQAQKDIHSIKF